MSATGEPLVVIGAGSNGIDEMKDLLNDAAVQWALLRFELGSGAFVRQKFVFLHLNGEETPAVQRGQANAYTAEAQRLLRAENQEGFHASLTVTQKEDVTHDELWARVGHYFVKDDIDYSLALERRDSGAQMSKSPKTPVTKAESPDLDSKKNPVLPGHVSTMLFSSGRDALRAVAEPMGRWNWVLVRPDPATLELVEGGTGSVDEMQERLEAHQEEVLSGLLRLGFGTGRLRRTKHIFVHAIGERVPVVSRGRLVAIRPQMEATMRKLAYCSVCMELTRTSDFTLESLIERVRKAAIIDDDLVGDDSPTKSAYSVEAFRDALKEESLVATPTTPVRATQNQVQWRDKAVADVVKLVHAPDGPLNWALFGPNLSQLRRRSWTASLPTPSPVTPASSSSKNAASLAGGPAGATTPAGGFTGALTRSSTKTF